MVLEAFRQLFIFLYIQSSEDPISRQINCIRCPIWWAELNRASLAQSHPWTVIRWLTSGPTFLHGVVQAVSLPICHASDWYSQHYCGLSALLTCALPCQEAHLVGCLREEGGEVRMKLFWPLTWVVLVLECQSQRGPSALLLMQRSTEEEEAKQTSTLPSLAENHRALHRNPFWSSSTGTRHWLLALFVWIEVQNIYLMKKF